MSFELDKRKSRDELARKEAAEAARRLRTAEDAANAIVAACRGTNETVSACEERIASWRAAWRGKIAGESFSRLENQMAFEHKKHKDRQPKPLPDTGKAEKELRAKIKQLDDAFAAYTLDYHTRLDEALKPGARTDPVSLQQEYLLKKRAYREARKKLVEKLEGSK